jgi:hypothetical protein
VNNAIARGAGLVAIASVGALVTASYASTLDDNIRVQGPAVDRAVEEAKRQPLAEVDVSQVPVANRADVLRAGEDASVDAFRLGIGISTGLVALGGVLGLVGIVNPRRRVEAHDCSGGQLVGATSEGSRQSPCEWREQSRALSSTTIHALDEA